MTFVYVPGTGIVTKVGNLRVFFLHSGLRTSECGTTCQVLTTNYLLLVSTRYGTVPGGTVPGGGSVGKCVQKVQACMDDGWTRSYNNTTKIRD